MASSSITLFGGLLPSIYSFFFFFSNSYSPSTWQWGIPIWHPYWQKEWGGLWLFMRKLRAAWKQWRGFFLCRGLPRIWQVFPRASLPGPLHLPRISYSLSLWILAHYIPFDALLPSLPLPFIWTWSHTARKLLRSSPSLCGNTAFKPFEVWKKFPINSGRREVHTGSLQ